MNSHEPPKFINPLVLTGLVRPERRGRLLFPFLFFAAALGALLLH